MTTSMDAKATAYADCEKSYGDVLEHCRKDAGSVAEQKCFQNIKTCKTICGQVKDPVARLHVSQCDEFNKISHEQAAVIDSVNKINSEEIDKFKKKSPAAGGIGTGVLGGFGGVLSPEEVKATFTMPIGVQPAPKIPPAASK